MTKTKKVTQDQVYKRSEAQEKAFKHHSTFLLYKQGACFEQWSAKIFIKYPKDGAGKVQAFMRINNHVDTPCFCPLTPREELKDPLYKGDKVCMVVASCSGYGYCKTSEVLSSLFDQIHFDDVMKWNSCGGAGVETVRKKLREQHGYELMQVS